MTIDLDTTDVEVYGRLKRGVTRKLPSRAAVDAFDRAFTER